MRRQESSEANAISRDKSKKINKDPLDSELTLDDLDHLSSEKLYDSKHVAGVAKFLFKKHGINFEKQFCVAVSLTQLEIFLKNSQPTLKERETIFILFRKNENQWITLSFVHSQHGVVALYKDSLGDNVPADIREVIKKHCSEATFKVHVGMEQKDINSGGPMALKNVEIIIESLKNDKELLIGGFENIKFCSSDDFQLVKDTFKEDVGKDIVETCTALAEEIGNSSEFKQEMAKLVDSCVDYLELAPFVQEYNDALQKEAEKLKENPDYVVNTDDIQVKRDKILNHSQIKILSDQTDIGKVINSNNEPVAFSTDLEKKYPEHFKKFKRLFKLLGVKGKKDISKRDDALWAVNTYLGISEDKTSKVYQALIPFEPDDGKGVKPDHTKPEAVVEPVGVDEISKQLEELAGKQVPGVDPEVKLLEQVLAEIAVVELKHEGMTYKSVKQLRAFFKVQYDGNTAIKKLDEKYIKVKESYEEWKEKGVKEIVEWANRQRRRLSPNKLCEAVAVMDRANQLVTGGHLLRDTQIMAILDILGSSGDQGRLCQIASGEGKTVIVSVLAAIKVLQGKQVDVITSNGVLAEEGVKNRKTFYGMFKISVAHNNQDESHTQGPRKCYTADVVYGSMSSFQFDFLKDSFEGYGTRAKRRFDFVILDEVDSLLLDDGGHIAKLAEPFPGFDSLKYVYIKIWQELVKAENELVREFEEALNKSRMEGNGMQELEETDERMMSELFINQQEKLVTKIKDSDPANIDLIPIHLRQFARDKVDVWIENAIHAKYFCNENEQYVVRQMQAGEEPKILPVDYQSTGVTLKNTMWSNGLHQFVQLKHNLQLTSESLTSSLISNIGYVKLYSSNIFGLTGTLGSTAEQQLLSSVYNVGYSKIPTFKPRKFEEICGRVVKDDKFKNSIVQDVLTIINNKRSVLIICPTIKFGRSLEKKLKKIKLEGSPKISTYFDEDTCDVVDKEIGVCEIIISTNIAGRGSDFKTSPKLEENGGLHVFVCFLPVNQRVEDQAFGRTARQGKAGSAQIVMRESDALALGFAAEGQDLEFIAIKERRDYLEMLRLENIREVQVTDVDFHDKIFGRFSGLYRQMISLEKKNPKMRYLLRDLKEFWAFWLHKVQPDEVAIKNVDNAFKRFTEEADKILGKKEDGRFIGGSITHNPYYCIQQAEYCIQKNLLDDAEESLNHAVQLGGDNRELLYPAYIKVFELSLERGKVIMRRFLDFVKKVLPINENITTDKEEYKRNAKEALLLAKVGLEREITYIQINFTGSSSNDVQTEQGHGHDDFLQILAPGSENLLVKHIWSKLTILHTHLGHVNSLLVQIENSFEQDLDIALSSRITNYWSASNNLSAGQAELREIIGDEEIRELSLRGLETMYTVNTIPADLGIGLVKPGLIQIAIGAAVFGTGMAFPPTFPVMAKIAEVFIIEGITDIIIAIATLGKTKFDIGSKLKSYATQAFTIGIFALVKYTQIAQKVINVCRKVITLLEKCPLFEKVCSTIVGILRTVIILLEHEIEAQRAYQSCSMVITAVGKGAGKAAALSFVQYIVCEKSIDTITERSRPQIVEYVTNTVKRTINREQYKHASKEYVLEHLSSVLQVSSNNIFKDATRMVVEKINSWVKSSDFPNAFRLQSDSYTEDVCRTLEGRVWRPHEDGVRCNSDQEMDDIIIAISLMIADHICRAMNKQLKNLVVGAEGAIKMFNHAKILLKFANS